MVPTPAPTPGRSLVVHEGDGCGVIGVVGYTEGLKLGVELVLGMESAL